MLRQCSFSWNQVHLSSMCLSFRWAVAFRPRYLFFLLVFEWSAKCSAWAECLQTSSCLMVTSLSSNQSLLFFLRRPTVSTAASVALSLISARAPPRSRPGALMVSSFSARTAFCWAQLHGTLSLSTSIHWGGLVPCGRLCLRMWTLSLAWTGRWSVQKMHQKEKTNSFSSSLILEAERIGIVTLWWWCGLP